MKEKIAALLLAMAMLCSCSTEAEAEEALSELNDEQLSQSVQEATEAEALPLTLACGRDFAAIHPAKRDDVDEALVPLLYESLVSLSDDYQWQPELAVAIEQNGNNYIIDLREDAVFSNGSTLRAADVVNSLYAAMEDGSRWENRLSIVEEAVVLTASRIRITVTESRQDFENLLTFPVTRERNDGTWLGSGEYCLPEEGNGLTLEKNPNYQGKADGPESILLTMLPNRDTLLDSLKIDKVNCIFDDLSSGEAMNLSEQCQTVEIGHLVFLGANGKEGLASYEEVRRAISAAVDRDVLADRVYSSKAKAAQTPFHPDYYRIADYKASDMSLDDARKLLETAGLQKNIQGYYGNEEFASMTLLYNSENAYRQQMAEMLQQQLENLGLKLELTALPYEEYMDALAEGDYDLYLGELAMDESMDIRRLFTQGEGYGYGAESDSLLSVYQSYQQGNASAELFLSVYEKNMPAIPLLYRQGLVIYSGNVEATVSSNPMEAFADISAVK